MAAADAVLPTVVSASRPAMASDNSLFFTMFPPSLPIRYTTGELKAWRSDHAIQQDYFPHDTLIHRAGVHLVYA